MFPVVMISLFWTTYVVLFLGSIFFTVKTVRKWYHRNPEAFRDIVTVATCGVVIGGLGLITLHSFIVS